MKRKLLFLLVLFSSSGFSQQWPQPGAEWTYCTGDMLWPEMYAGFTKKYYTRDTIINGDIYNVIETEIHSTDTLFTYYTRFSNDTVYRWVNNQEYLFFHFQLQIDEVFTTYRSYGGFNDSTCYEMLTLKVIQQGTLTVNGEDQTWWRLQDTMSSDEHIIRERIGFVSLWWLWDPYEQADCGWVSDVGYSTLGDYEDNSFASFGNPCPMAGLENDKLNHIQIYPNPTSEKINFIGQAESYFIYSMDGRLIQKGNLEGENYINVESLTNGLYTIQIITEENQIYKTTFVKE